MPRLISSEPTVAGIQLKPTPLGFVVWLACLAIALAITLTYLGVIHWRPTISLDVTEADPVTGMVQVTCLNHGLRMARLHVPWPESGLPATQNGQASEDYGIAVDVREQATKGYRQAPYVLPCWKYEGRPLSEDLVIELAPHVPATLMLDSRQLRSGAPIESFRVALLRPDRRSVAQREIRVMSGR
jgi:hypothetical protein